MQGDPLAVHDEWGLMVRMEDDLEDQSFPTRVSGSLAFSVIHEDWQFRGVLENGCIIIRPLARGYPCATSKGHFSCCPEKVANTYCELCELW